MMEITNLPFFRIRSSTIRLVSRSVGGGGDGVGPFFVVYLLFQKKLLIKWK